ncbi:MAG TPA: SigB/SigF/SigG family RNA polymerase sigma factor [Solirubrobacteraceae bacterium]|nr:SigB/SigF/SigG family RNA polymerase sigma factor [Solirubrobacteraceae bacterium]
MIERYLPLADKLARRYAHTSEPLDDLIQVARIGLMNAVDRWDPSRGTQFSTYAVPTITGELRRHFRDRTWTIKPPRDVQERYLDVQRARQALWQQLGREPTARDVGEYLGLTTEHVVEALQAGDAHSPTSLDTPLRADEHDGHSRVDNLADHRHDIAHAETRITITQLANTVLDDREREVIRLRFHDDLIQREIGDHIGRSQMHVSRILHEALRRLQAAAEQDAAMT